ncbi:serine hydrolase domain-containing protein [Microbacterium sp. NPDC089695]|uniref:serine hydrolase domain-containing protein n=1 Tax=Microbacterium sp. NPDC089695 TaxID=3364198 RepID=UPI003821199A
MKINPVIVVSVTETAGEEAMDRRIQPSAAAIARVRRIPDATSHPFPSLSFALFDRSGILFHEGRGEFQLDGRAPTRDTIYRICSLSKSFCAAVILVLREQGRLSLDDPVSLYVPEFPDYIDSHGVMVPITVRMLMTNSSGLPEDNAWADYSLGIAREALTSLLHAGLGYADVPDVGFQYSNLGFAILGRLVENITGQRFEHVATEQLLKPLGLSSTHYDVAEYPEQGEGGAGIAHGFVTFDEGETWQEKPFVETGAFACLGSMYSTPTDIARWSAWLSAPFDEGYGDDAILSRASRRLMQRIATTVQESERSAQPELDNVGYGLGLFVDEDHRFGGFAYHAGGLPGFTSHMRWHCASGLGVVMFANTNSVSLTRWSAQILRTVLDDRALAARRIALWPETFAAAEEIDVSIRGDGDFGTKSLFAPNVLIDVPADVRARRLRAVIAEVGGLVLDPPPLARRLRWTESSAQLCWSVLGESGDLDCRIEITPVFPRRVQRLEITVAKTEERAIVGRSYTPVVVDH